MSSRDRLLIGLAAPSAAGYLALTLAGDLRTRPAVYLSIHAALFALYLAGVAAVLRAPRAADGGSPESAALAVILGSAFVFRAMMLPAAPTLSDDVWRYIWEGGLQLHNINPYRYVPSAPELAPYRDAVYQKVNYKDLPAIYPPVMQWAFAAGALLSRSVWAMKSVFVAADMALALLLSRLAAALGIPAGRVLLYAWNPLVVVEVAGSGHNDPLAVCLLVGSVLGIIGGRRALSMGTLALSALAKLYPFSLLPLFARKVRPVHLLMVPAAAVVCYLPYLGAGANLFLSARQYAERWRFNDSVFALLVALIEASGVSAPAKRWADARGFDSLYTQPHMLARGAAALIALAALVVLARRLDPDRPADLPRSIYRFTGLALLLQPAMHPWYLLWIAPWLSLFPSPAWLALTALAPLAYAFGGWVRWVEYLPFFALLALGRAGPGGGGWLWRRARRLW